MRRGRLGVGVLAVALALVAGCSRLAPTRGDSAEAPGAGSSAGDGAGGTPPGEPTPGNGPQSGTLTAGDWDDNLNFPLFQSYVAQAPQDAAAFVSANRVMITVRDATGRPLSNARVSVSDGTGTRLDAPTASDGRLLFLPSRDGAQGESFTVTVTPPTGQPGETLTTAVQGYEWDLTVPGSQSAAPSELDLAFVVDATGSMGDEIDYLKAELQGIVDSVRAGFPQVSARFALIVYRDDGDDYVVRTFDFTSDLQAFQSRLRSQSAGGGGDYPEAMERGLGAIHQLTWRTGNTARLTFLVADAPPHTGQYTTFLQEANRARKTGIKVYPVAASGVAKEAEYLMRISAQLTLARYIFLTDDSGIGAPHEEPAIPCYQVRKLNQVLTQAITAELSGQRQPVPAEQVIRAVGNPQDGRCTLSGDRVAYL